MRTLYLLLGLLPFLALGGRAQEPPATPRAEVEGSWSYLHMDEHNGDAINFNKGWKASINGNLTNWLGAVGEFSGHYGTQVVPFGLTNVETDADMHTFLFGPRFFYRTQNWTPYVHTLFGKARFHQGDMRTPDGTIGLNRTENPFAMAVGAGVDVTLTDNVAWPVQVDYLLTRPNDVRVNNFRAATGLKFRFGRF
ncbi:MAG: outer membrane beta-barrel protein [Acidobacteria bacterium]|nr:outer membrane beta-barrel protein [Acidobacteriota bacterium]